MPAARQRVGGLPALALALAAIAGCASTPPTHPDAFSFAVMGDTQYNAAEERAFVEMLASMEREDLAFVVHVGDFIGGVACTDELYRRRRAELDASAHPLIYTPGDNEWTDCHQRRRGGRDPAERLAKLREVFFGDRWSLGRRRIETMAQDQCIDPGPREPEALAGSGGCRCPAHPENRFWSRGGVRFVTLNVPGSDNNERRGPRDEPRCRNEANRRWLELAVAASERSQTRALVILFQANPWSSKKEVYRPLLAQIEAAARRVRKPVLVVHGDTHDQHVDSPFLDNLGNPNLAITRLETFGSPFTGWVKVVVDPDDPNVFRFEPRLFRIVPPG